ncbi:type II toxin-antitoxin system Phd/YefM family antitoxin [Luteimicrobium album]|nr:type II toxin-antitoxin system Phd/YefM family antitoxin [Luteimicrobium album]
MGIPMRELRDNLSDTVARVAYTHERVTVTKNGKPVAALVSADDLDLLEQIDMDADVRAYLAAKKADDGERISLADLRADLLAGR